MEKEARSTTAKLPKMIIRPFKGTPTDWVRFENMLVTQVQNKSISEEEKFGYLLEMVNPNVRAKIATLKPGKIGYLDRLGKTEIQVWLEQTCCERAQRRNSEPSCRQRIQLLEDSGILREREQKL